MRPNVLVAINVVGCSLSALLLVSGVLFYPLISLVFGMLGPALLALVLGFWFGGYGRVQAAIALTVGNAAVLAGFGLNLAAFSFFENNTDGGAIFFLGGALVMLFGYAVMAGIPTRPLFRAWSRPA